MAGLYFHVPFCRKACHYCDFHFSTITTLMPDMVDAMAKELGLRMKENSFPDIFETLYFGGGTPSLLTKSQLSVLLDSVYEHAGLSASAEITLEANPEDLSLSYLQDLQSLGFNRLSIGVQSFDPDLLVACNRSHNSSQARQAVENAQNIGFDNISIDLIYGQPNQTNDIWQADLDIALALGVQHISAYCLTIEEKTVFGRRHAKGELLEMPEEAIVNHYHILCARLEAAGFEHYEVSNWALESRNSRHNSGYWDYKPYLGIGPAAHSYASTNRYANIANNALYLQALKQNKTAYTNENLSPQDQANEYLLTSLRTKKGIFWPHLYDICAQKGPTPAQHRYMSALVAQGLGQFYENGFGLNSDGFLLADGICSRLFFD